MDLLPFRKNLSFFAIDMDRLALDKPQLIVSIAQAVGKALEEGHYKRVPVTTFPMRKVKEAMELMKTGRHVGKVCRALLTTP
jgi:NADPH:quinone reductase-like Zn-dependent oxidoreductase